MGLPIDYQTEIDEITNSLIETSKELNIWIEPATVDSLNNLLLIRPKILHLSCHGDYDKQNETFFLAFESKKEIGLLDKLNTGWLNTLLKNNIGET